MISLKIKKIFFNIAMVCILLTKFTTVMLTDYILSTYPELFYEANPATAALLQISMPFTMMVFLSLMLGWGVFINKLFIRKKEYNNKINRGIDDMFFFGAVFIMVFLSFFDLAHDYLIFRNMELI